MKSLKDLAIKYGTDKEGDHSVHGEGHKFCNFYDHHLSSIRYDKLKIFEIGIFDGASLRMWQDYFENSEIYGVDILEDSRSKLINEGRIKSFKLDAGDRESLQKFKEQHGPFDIVIDDGSHFTNHQWISWDIFSDDSKIFIWEDLHSSRMPYYIRGNDARGQPLDYAKKYAKESTDGFLFDKNNDEKHVTFLKNNQK